MARIKDLLQENLIIEDIKAQDKPGVLREFAELITAAGKSRDADEIIRILMERESLGSTGIGGGIAIPHGKLPRTSDMIVAFGRSSSGVAYQSMDGEPVYLFFLLMTPEENPGEHLKTLARISRILKNPTLRENLRNATRRQELQRLIEEEDGKYPQPHAVSLK